MKTGVSTSDEPAPLSVQEAPPPRAGIQMINFPTGATLIVDSANEELKLMDAEASTLLVINISDKGLVLNLSALQLNIRALDEINLSGRQINIEAAEHLSLKSGGTMQQTVETDLLVDTGGTSISRAKIQKIEATLGNAEIKANDDVRLDGERVKLNCDP